MIYLDNAATSYPKPECVYKRVDSILRDVGGSPGRATHRMALEASRVVFEAREALALLLGVRDSSRVIFTKNSTEAINIALKGLLEPGDHIITTTFEHNSVARPVRRLESEGIEVTRVCGSVAGLVGPLDIKSAITDKTKLVCITHASNLFGAIEPIKEIGVMLKKQGVSFMVDASQTVGALPVEPVDMDIDILASTGHKALFGVQGTGVLYMKEGIEPRALVDGGTGEVDEFLALPERLEAGTMNMPGIGGLGAGVKFIMETGLSTIREHEQGLITALLEGLSPLKGVSIIGPPTAEQRVSLVSFTIDGIDARDAGMAYDQEFSLMVRCGTHCTPQAHKVARTYPAGAIRISPGFFNTMEDIEKFIDATATIIKRL